MTRRIANAVILDGPAAAMLSQAANLDQLRINARGKSERLYQLLMDIQLTRMAYLSTSAGQSPEETPETRKPEIAGYVTTKTLAKRAGVDPHTIRNHINSNLLQAQKHDRAWLIRTEDAEQYLAGRRPA
ncbi:helix-turn-helix domain-containing protein [Microbacterium sp. ZW T5_56]|uniref:helix-turn-helix domain-containing protein n=1 Tax=Microbacterium sp. ZW T5_56 TaxID=3378081 RepID=UPI0038527C85